MLAHSSVLLRGIGIRISTWMVTQIPDELVTLNAEDSIGWQLRGLALTSDSPKLGPRAITAY